MVQQMDRIAQLEEFDRQKSKAYQLVQEAKDSLEKEVEILNSKIQENGALLIEKSKELNTLELSHQSSYNDL